VILWLAVAAMIALVLAALLWPLLRRDHAETAARDVLADRAVYRDQLAELERDRARGLVPPDAAATAKLEIERRLLATDRAALPEGRQSPSQRRALALAIALVLAAGATLLYLDLGAPGAPAHPALRAEDGPVPAPTVARDPALEAEATALGAKLDAEPSDALGWAKLGNLLLQLGRYGESRTAFEQAIQQGAPDAETQRFYGEALTQAEGGSVGPEAENAFRKALAVDPQDPRARYYLGLAAAEARDFARALAAWRALLAETPPDAPWRPLLLQSIAAVERAQAAGVATTPGAAPAPLGPDEGALAAAAAMTPEERESFIRNMVEGLAQRLEREPGNIEGWRRLGHAYGVLGEAGKSRDAWGKAVALAPDRFDLLLDYAAAILAATPEDAAFDPVFGATVAKIRAAEPANPAGLYFAALGEARAGRKDAALALFRQLLDALPADAPQRQQIEQEIEALEAG